MITGKKRIVLVLLAAFLLVPALCFSFPDTALAGTQTFVLPDETKSTPANASFTNGDFELPASSTIYTPMELVPGWDVVPIDPSLFSNPFAYYCQLMPTGTVQGNSQSGAWFAELCVQVPERYYQPIITTPGSRLYWSFYHRAILYYPNRTPGNDITNFYMRPSGTPSVMPTSAQLIVSANDGAYIWHNYKGVYVVPAGQTSTEVSFHALSAWTATFDNGCQIDNVTFQTASKLIAKKSISTSAADDAMAVKGEVVTITVAITNWGETDASRCVFRDILSDGLDYVAGSATINGVAANTLATFNSTTDELRINYGTSATAGAANTNGGIVKGSIAQGTAGTTGQGQTITLAYQALVTGNLGYVVRNQASTTYNDSGWESYNASDYTTYSSVLGKTLSASDEKTYVNEFTITGSPISGRVWADQNADGTLDAAEVRYSGVSVSLYASTDTTFATPLLTTTTNASGEYTFSGLEVGTYVVAAVLPDYYHVTVLANDNDAAANGNRGIISGLGITSTDGLTNKDIGFAPNKTITGRVSYDLNQDGMIDASDTPYAGATVTLYLASDTTFSTPATDANGNPLVRTTDANGLYEFLNLPNAVYQAVVTTPSGYQVTLKTSSTDNDAVANGTRAVVSPLDMTGTGPVANEADFGFMNNTCTITVSKMVKGNLSDSKQGFNFQIVLTGVTTTLNYTGSSIISGVSAPANGTISSGNGTVTLRHGQSITIEGVPYGTAYTISENLGLSRYTAVITEQNGNPITLNGSTEASGTLTYNGSLLFENTMRNTPPTGVLLDVIPFALMAVLAGGVVALSLQLARRRRPSRGRNR